MIRFTLKHVLIGVETFFLPITAAYRLGRYGRQDATRYIRKVWAA